VAKMDWNHAYLIFEYSWGSTKRGFEVIP
jgi:hypothetical protein